MPTSDSSNGSPGLLAALMASGSHAIILCSLDDRIEAWSRGAEAIYGHAPSEAVGRSAELTVPQDRRDEHRRVVDESLAGRAVDGCDTQRVRKNGERFPVTVCALPVRDAQGRVAGYATIEREITDRRRAADRLHEAVAQAQEASAAKSRFLANVSHELRTPMNAIMGMTALALEEDLAPETRDYLETARESASAMLHMVNDLLDLARLETSTFEPEETTFSPREVVEHTARMFEHTAHDKGLRLACRIAPDTPASVLGDRARLEQVLTNLVSNALKFTPSGGVTVRLTPTRFEKSRCRLEFRVEDTGIGVSEQEQTRIFAPFSRGEGDTTRERNGAGLGLTITRHLVNCFGSELHVESAPGEGSCFWFTLNVPLAERPTRPGDDPSPCDASHDSVAGPGLFDRAPAPAALRVLLVEDTPANRKVVQRVLSKRGHRVDVAENGREAVEAVRREEFDVVLMDVQMPVMDGLEATEAIRDWERRRGMEEGVPVIALTAHSLRGDRQRCLRAGMNDYLAKPLELDRLIRMVESARERAWRPNGDGVDGAPERKGEGECDADRVFDPQAALARLRGDRTLLLELIDFFDEDAPRLREAIRAGMDEPDFARLQRAAHSLKALAATFDASPAIVAAGELEEAAKRHRARALPNLVNRLERETDRLAAALDGYRREPVGNP